MTNSVKDRAISDERLLNDLKGVADCVPYSALMFNSADRIKELLASKEVLIALVEEQQGTIDELLAENARLKSELTELRSK